jgi:O-antigen ligase
LLEIIGIIVFLLALVYANSRSPYLGIVLAIVLVSAVKRDRKVIFSLLAMCSILTVFYLNSYIRILEPNTSHRFDVWREVFFKFREAPLFLGYGFDAGIEFLVPKLGASFTDTHSIHVGVLYELGVVGFIIWFSLYASLARDFLQSKKTFLVVLSGCLSIYGVGSGMTDGMTYISRAKEHWFILWIPISILVASVLTATKPPHRPSLPS